MSWLPPMSQDALRGCGMVSCILTHVPRRTLQEYDECLKHIEKILEETEGLCEYAIYVKALILRQRGAGLHFWPRRRLVMRRMSSRRTCCQGVFPLGGH